MIGLVDEVFLGQGFGQAFVEARDVALGGALAATGLPLGLASVVVRAMQAMEYSFVWKQVVVIGVAAVVEAQMGSSLEELMGRLLGVTSGQWMLMEAYPPAVGLRGWVVSALPVQCNDSWQGLLCSTE